jgi:hypothetical protein
MSTETSIGHTPIFRKIEVAVFMQIPPQIPAPFLPFAFASGFNERSITVMEAAGLLQSF